MQVDLGLLCQHMPVDMFSHGGAHVDTASDTCTQMFYFSSLVQSTGSAIAVTMKSVLIKVFS